MGSGSDTQDRDASVRGGQCRDGRARRQTPAAPPDLFRVYLNLGTDGYPPEWHETIKFLVRELADDRCQRCGHPYVTAKRRGHLASVASGVSSNGEWSPCDERCTHAGPARADDHRGEPFETAARVPVGDYVARGWDVEAQWRILTVHHLNGVKADCRWWNLAALCQRCHLVIQGKVVMNRVYPFEHTEWFKPYAAGFYASAYLGEELTREQAIARQDELLALERSV